MQHAGNAAAQAAHNFSQFAPEAFAIKTARQLGVAGGGQDRVGRLFGDHVDAGDDEEARNFREHRGVDHAQIAGAVDVEIAVEHGLRIARRPDRAGAGGVMAPGIVLHELADLVVGLHFGAGQFLLDNDAGIHGGLGEHAHELDAGHHRIEVVAPAFGVVGVAAFLGVGAFLEIMEIDLRRIARVRRAQFDGAAVVFGVGLEDAPGQIILLIGDQLRVAGEIAREFSDQREDEQVGQRAFFQRALDEREGRAIGGVDALAPARPLLALRIVAREGGVLQDGPVLPQLVGDADLVAVLQILADAGQIDAHLDAVAVELLFRTDARQHQQLRGGALGAGLGSPSRAQCAVHGSPGAVFGL